MTSPPTPTGLKNDGGALVISWSDGVIHRLPWTLLRKACPCATCKVERERPQPKPLFAVLSPAEARPLTPQAIRPIGNYAYGVQFSDGHNTGIYSLEFLRQLGEQATQPVP